MLHTGLFSLGQDYHSDLGSQHSSNPITPLAWALEGDTLHLLDKTQLQTPR